MKAEEFVCPKCGSTEGWWVACDKLDTDGAFLHEVDCFTLECDNVRCDWKDYDCGND